MIVLFGGPFLLLSLLFFHNLVDHHAYFVVHLNCPRRFSQKCAKTTIETSSNDKRAIDNRIQSTIEEISFWYERRNLNKVRLVVQRSLYPALLRANGDGPREDLTIRRELENLFDFLQRWAFNYCIQTILGQLPTSKVAHSSSFLRILDSFLYDKALEGNLSADTINVLLSDAINHRNDISRADLVFRSFFMQSQSVKPTVRTLNIMMEAHRRVADRPRRPIPSDDNTNSSSNRVGVDSIVESDEEDASKRDYSMVHYYYSLFSTFSTSSPSFPSSSSSSSPSSPSSPPFSSSFSSSTPSASTALLPDCYTLSTLVRVSYEPAEIVSLLASNPSAVSPPVLRCAIESLGKLGAPSAALSLFLKQHYQVGSNSSESSSLAMLTSRRKDGDAIVAALLHCPGCRINLTSSAEIDGIPSAALTYFQGKLSAEVAFRLLLLLEGDRDGQTLLPVRCSSKGYTLLATHIQRSLRRLHEVPLSPNQEQGQTDRLRLRQVAIASLRSSRERLFDALRADLLQERRQREAADRSGLLATSIGDAGEVTLPQPQTRGSQRQQQEEEEGQLELNGRLVDALVRSFLCGEVEEAKAFWKRRLLPLLLLKDGRTASPSPLGCNEGGNLETGLETFMYVCGRNGRPDIGLEIARSVRKRIQRSQQQLAPKASAAGQEEEGEEEGEERRTMDRRTEMKLQQQFRERLYRSYLQGRRDLTSLRATVGSSSGPSSQSLSLLSSLAAVPVALEALLQRNWEDSLRLELGALGLPDSSLGQGQGGESSQQQIRKGTQRIRIRFK